MSVKVRKIPVLELFGPTLQGEGQNIGRKTMFVRTAGCDYSCSWCDSSFTWNGTEKDNIRLLTPLEIFDELKEIAGNNFNHVTISGGNPALIGDQMGILIDLLHSDDIEVGLETQGSMWKDWFLEVDDLTISPKPPSSLMKPDLDKLDAIIFTMETRNHPFSLKVVVFDDEDFDFARMINDRYRPKRLYLSTGNIDSVETGSIAERLLSKTEWLWDKVIAHSDMNNAMPLPQLHTLIYGNRREV